MRTVVLNLNVCSYLDTIDIENVPTEPSAFIISLAQGVRYLIQAEHRLHWKLRNSRDSSHRLNVECKARIIYFQDM